MRAEAPPALPTSAPRLRSLPFLLLFVVEEFQPGPPPLIEKPLRALVGLSAHDEPLFPAGVVAGGDPPAGAAVELYHYTGHRRTFIVDNHGDPHR